jgi:ribosomal-protein-alanine N-acetyltransferase
VSGPERIETARLWLRRPRAGDAEAIFSRYAGDPRVTRYMGWPTHRSGEATRAFLDHCEAEWQRWKVGAYLIEARAGGALLGGTGLHLESPVRAATGYVFARDAWGMGYATEALRAVVELAARLGVLRLQALCHPDHAASQRVLEKGGFTREGVLRAHTAFPNLGSSRPSDVVCFARIFD